LNKKPPFGGFLLPPACGGGGASVTCPTRGQGVSAYLFTRITYYNFFYKKIVILGLDPRT